MQKWSHLLQKPNPLPCWNKIWTFTFSSSRCLVQREMAVKILKFGYRTPEILHRHDSGVPSFCWRCDSSIGTHLHIFWQCPQIQPFWVNVMSILQTLTNTSLPLDPLHYLLGLPFPGLQKTIKKHISYILLAAQRVIPMCWLSRDTPAPFLLLNTITEICKMEYLTASVSDTILKFNKIWELWDLSKPDTSLS